MRIQHIRLFTFSSLAIVALTLVWGLRQIPTSGELAAEQVRSSLENESTILRGAVRTAVEALRLRTLDVLQAEPARAAAALEHSSLMAVAMLSLSDAQTKTLSFSSKRTELVGEDQVKTWAAEWPLNKLGSQDSHFTKVADIEGRPYFALAMPVRRDGEDAAFAIGIFAAADFPLNLPADRARDISVFDGRGVALALNHAAYVGADIRRQPLVAEILESDVVNVRTEWTRDDHVPMMGSATRIADANLYAAVEAKVPRAYGGPLGAWSYLILCATGAVALNFALFAGLLRPLFSQLASAEAQVENLRRLLADAPSVVPGPVATPADAAISPAELPAPTRAPSVDHAPASAPEPARLSLAKLVDSCLRSVDDQVKAADVGIDRVGLDDVLISRDVLQLQTAFEEILKNSIEAVTDRPKRRLTISAFEHGGRVALTVEDSGPGVSPEGLPRIFEPFFTTREQAGGMGRGLGLNVVRRIIEEIGGSVTARNLANGEGFLCELTWPIEGPAVRAARPRAAATPDPILRASVNESVNASVNASPNTSRLIATSADDLSDLDFINGDDGDDFTPVPTVARHATGDAADDVVRRPRVRDLE